MRLAPKNALKLEYKKNHERFEKKKNPIDGFPEYLKNKRIT
jgi:hypothetical protein